MPPKAKPKKEPERSQEPPRPMHESSIRAANNFDAVPVQVLFVRLGPLQKKSNDTGRVIELYETLEDAQRAVVEARGESVHQGFLFESTAIEVKDFKWRKDKITGEWSRDYAGEPEYVNRSKPQYHIEVPTLGLVFGHNFK